MARTVRTERTERGNYTLETGAIKVSHCTVPASIREVIYSAGTHPDSENQDVDDRSIINCGRTLFARLNKYDSGELGGGPAPLS